MVVQKTDYIFLAMFAFILGVVSGGLNFSFTAALILIFPAIIILIIYKFPLPVALLAAVLFLTGNFYYLSHDYNHQKQETAIQNLSAFESLIIAEPRQTPSFQQLRIKINDPSLPEHQKSIILIQTENYPNWHYHQQLNIEGKINPLPQDSYGRYLKKEGIHGLMFYPSITAIGQYSPGILGHLFTFRSAVKENINRLFSQHHAAFLSGILLGDRNEFTPQFLQKLSLSGTMHLTALSGLHMAIIIFIALSVFSVLFNYQRRPVIIFTFLVITLFVAMTGFKISAIRASFMAFIVGLSEYSGRLYKPSRAIVMAAFLITISNPQAPVFDLAFQLSFAATLSIIYFAPILKKLSFFQKDGFLFWRRILAITFAAQIGVMPITIINFANFSFTALPANLAVLIIIPVLMGLGLLTVTASFILPPLAYLLSQPTAFLIEYASYMITVFAHLKIPFNPNVGLSFAIAYYGILIWGCFMFSPALQKLHRLPEKQPL